MKLEPIFPHCEALLRSDGDAIAIEDLVEVLLVNLKHHPHYGNVFHHIAGGDWGAIDAALKAIILDRSPISTCSTVTRNLYRALSGRGPANLRPFRQWFLHLVELESSTLFTRLLERRIDTANAELHRLKPDFRASALRILTRR